MKKILFSRICIILLINNSVYAESIKSVDQNQTMSNEEFMKKFMAIENRKQVDKEQIKLIDEIQKSVDSIKKTNKKN